MHVNGKPFETIWADRDKRCVYIIDQRKLPHQFVIETLRHWTEAETAIFEMHVRGAPLIGACAAFGMYLAAIECVDKNDSGILKKAAHRLEATRPTAVNLQWALEYVKRKIDFDSTAKDLVEKAFQIAVEIAEFERNNSLQIGKHGLNLIQSIHQKNPDRPVQILTHCNAGWLACIDYGTATAPVYASHQQGIPLHVWVDETRPRNQGASLTAWELGQEGIDHTVIPDNTGGHLMRQKMVDMVIVGADRVAANGDAANKIGTYLKALAAKDNNIPFYVAIPSSTIDISLDHGDLIPIEQRNQDEVKFITGKWENQQVKVDILPEGSKAANYGFDVTPSRLITGLITEKGLCKAETQSISRLFPRL